MRVSEGAPTYAMVDHVAEVTGLAPDKVRQVLEAMREPNEAMLEAGFNAPKPPFGFTLVGYGAANCWDAMIEAAQK